MDQEKITTRDILKMIALGAVVISIPVMPGLSLALVASNKYFKGKSKRDAVRIIKRVEKQQMASFKEVGNDIVLQITINGERRLLEYEFEDLGLKTKRTDGKLRLIIFDIPEVKKAAREAFRRKILKLGFVRVQDSVFACAFPCQDEIDFLCHFLGISAFVSLVVVDKIERGEGLLLVR